MKYIMFKQSNGMELPIIFPKYFEHVKVVQMMNNTFPGIKAESAGFIDFNDTTKIYCYGGSISLKLQSNKIDTPVLQKLINKLF